MAAAHFLPLPVEGSPSAIAFPPSASPTSVSMLQHVPEGSARSRPRAGAAVGAHEMSFFNGRPVQPAQQPVVFGSLPTERRTYTTLPYTI